MAKKRFVDANEALEQLKTAEKEMLTVSMLGFKAVSMDSVISFVDTLPTVDAAEVVHGRWLRNPIRLKYFCSACGNGAFNKNFAYGARYCPACGARMDLEE